MRPVALAPWGERPSSAIRQAAIAAIGQPTEGHQARILCRLESGALVDVAAARHGIGLQGLSLDEGWRYASGAGTPCSPSKQTASAAPATGVAGVAPLSRR